MQKREAAITNSVLNWLRGETRGSCAVEIKHTRGEKNFLMSELKEHQRDWLVAASGIFGCQYKIPDVGYGYNPFDGFILKKADAFVVIVYPKWTVAIQIMKLVNVKMPSLSEDDALQIAQFRRPSKGL